LEKTTNRCHLSEAGYGYAGLSGLFADAGNAEADSF
jgi:hypothetical protein